MAKIKIESSLLTRLKKVAEAVGYSSVEEFITHIIDKELARYEAGEDDKKVTDRLRGLGYIE